MPKGPQGQKRSADGIGNAVRVMKIATGEVAEDTPDTGKEYARKGELIGGRRRAATLSKQQKSLRSLRKLDGVGRSQGLK